MLNVFLRTFFFSSIKIFSFGVSGKYRVVGKNATCSKKEFSISVSVSTTNNSRGWKREMSFWGCRNKCGLNKLTLNIFDVFIVRSLESESRLAFPSASLCHSSAGLTRVTCKKWAAVSRFEALAKSRFLFPPKPERSLTLGGRKKSARCRKKRMHSIYRLLWGLFGWFVGRPSVRPSLLLERTLLRLFSPRSHFERGCFSFRCERRFASPFAVRGRTHPLGPLPSWGEGAMHLLKCRLYLARCSLKASVGRFLSWP